MSYGIFRDRDHDYAVRYPADDLGEAVDETYAANITGVIRMLDKSDVMTGWAKREVAIAAVRNASVLMSMVEQSPVTEGALAQHPAVSWLKGIPGYQRDRAADLGTRVHAAAESLGRGERPQVDDDVRPMVEAYFRGFVRRHRPRFHPDYVEFMVASTRHRYAGTMDMACRIGDDVWLLDVKTSSKPIGTDPRAFPYPETALQLAAGRWADFAGRPGDARRYPIPPATRYGVVAVTPDECELVEFSVTERDFEAFLALRAAWDWVMERKAGVKLGYAREAA